MAVDYWALAKTCAAGRRVAWRAAKRLAMMPAASVSAAPGSTCSQGICSVHAPVEGLRIDDVGEDGADRDAAGQPDGQADGGDQGAFQHHGAGQHGAVEAQRESVASSRARSQTLAASVTARPKRPISMAAASSA
jgi:hypothetical protein